MKKKGTNPKDLIGITKPRIDTVPPSSIIYQALAMSDGATKYGPYNWRDQPVQFSIYYAAIMRHMFQVFDGEWFAEDSKKPHLAHAVAAIGIIIDAYETGNLIDDRPKPGAAAKIISKWTQKKLTPWKKRMYSKNRKTRKAKGKK